VKVQNVIQEVSDTPFYAHSKIAKRRLLASLCLSRCLSVRSSVCLSLSMDKLGFYWTDFHEILYLNIFLKSVVMIQVSFISDKNNGYLSWRRTCIYIRCILLQMINFSDRCCRGNQNTNLCSINVFPKIVPFMKSRGKSW
jgi:hypothetical protein